MARIRNVLYVVVLTAALVALSSEKGYAAPITTDSDPITWGFDSEILSNDYVFGFYTFRIAFQQVFTSFSLTVDDHVVALEGLNDAVGSVGEFVGLPGYQCVEMGLDDGLPQCVFFEVSPVGEFASFPTPGEEGDYLGSILIGIGYTVFGFPECDGTECIPEDPVDIGEILDFSWFTSFYNPELGRYTLGHAPHDSLQFVDVGTLHCDNTNDIDVCLASVPEPGSVLLLSSGIAGLVARQVRRRRRRL